MIAREARGENEELDDTIIMFSAFRHRTSVKVGAVPTINIGTISR